MSAIRERCSLYVVNLPKKLTSRRNLQAHFSQFGDVKNVSVDKELKTGTIEFSNHFEAQTAKTQGTKFEDESLNILWSRSPLDPRGMGRQELAVVESDTLWQEDDKECFGVETAQTKANSDDKKQSAKDMIKQHLKLTGVKKRLGPKIGDPTKQETSSKSPIKISKVGSKPLVTLRKSLLSQGNKQKLGRKDGEPSHRSVVTKLKKSLVSQEEVSKPITSSNCEQVDLKFKLSMLDERDKLIRKETVQDSNIKTALIIKGTCPDMCPERERILRQLRHGVATYERIPGTYQMDENKAVKEYIRSSADQEVPLAHDLRPGPVLSLTMNYLITNIINRVDNSDENKAIWYSFCWNRLRSIRKDIILQQLCDMETVEIVEQCARFHICCYDHMWGADVSGFDDKINTQNLIDCLQTLKHMYEDLAKHNVTCPNEPEFYSYLILLKLKSGDVMWEYQQYSLDVQFSSHVQFAIEAYMAFKNNMYSKYFSLVKKASYLTACLMQRYFDEVRTQALKTMMKAYCLPGKNVGLSSSFIVSSLKFDSEKNALRFCEKEEADVKPDYDGGTHDDYISTSSFLIREKRMPISNAVVGENNPLPVYTPHEVHTSFDELGKLKTSFQITLDEGVVDMSSGSVLSDEDNMDVNTCEIDAEQKSFKFSISPTKIPENLFSKTLLSDKDEIELPQSGGVGIKSEVTQFFNDNKDLSKTQFSPSNTFSMGEIEPFEVKQDFSQEMICEDNDVVISSTDEQMLQAENNTLKMYEPDHQHPFSTNFSVDIKPNLLIDNKENKAPFFTNSNDFQLQKFENVKPSKEYNSVENFKFTFTMNKNEREYTDLHREEHSKTLNKTSMYNIMKNDVTSEFLSQSSTDDKNKRGMMFGSTHTSFLFPQDELKESNEITKKYAPEEEDNELEDLEAMREALLLEKRKKEQFEEEKRQMEEMERVELEKQRRKIEEQNVLKALRKDVSQRLKAINVRKYARQWKKKVEKLKRTRQDFPMLIQLSVSDHLSLWGTVNSIPTQSVFQRARDKINLKKISSHVLRYGITESYKFIGYDLAEMLAKSAVRKMKKGVKNPVYWKLVFSLPWTNSKSCSELCVFNKLMGKWCRQAFYKRKDACLGSVECFMTSLAVPVNICVRLSDNGETSQGLLEASDASIFVIVNEAESKEMCLNRLRDLVGSYVKSDGFSIVIMNIGGNKLDQVLEIQLEEFRKQNFIDSWKIAYWSSPDSIMDNLNFLTQEINVAPNIKASTLELLVKQVSDDFFDALSSSQHICQGLVNAMKRPNFILDLYNTCLTKLENLLVSNKLAKYFNFPEEFKSYVPLHESGGPELMCGKTFDGFYKMQISKKLNVLKLPLLHSWPPSSCSDLVEMLKSCCCKVHDMEVFVQIFRMIDLKDDSSLLQHMEQVQWLEIVEIWAQCSIRHSFFHDEDKQFFVMFDRNDIEKVIKTRWWIKQTPEDF
ncbi:uncharacterized protein LOC124354606 isoform X1 [Homalodisca vitripennis]|uniref:uncharacterized protein LOC124354606 isoform X1 n=1 Tax=Homalodisca vitripennis TaxID=197043 RepID=UPI001EECDDE2|nr:uncharacterized protein LOC124354606 isoform X1 [Homalodisca vitripennis]